MWNDTESPLAVFFTFRCYGTWLHGDERGSVDRNHNIYGTPRISPNKNWRKFNEQKINHAPVKLTAKSRGSVEKSIRETCTKRKIDLLAVNIRTNHIHSVIDIGSKNSKQILIALKANATRQLREDNLWKYEHSPWADKGSCRKLWNERSIAEATDYVINGQGDKLPSYDWW
jgi:REP element-mobilizing transposase RayT